jgi:hypothetical protein
MFNLQTKQNFYRKLSLRLENMENEQQQALVDNDATKHKNGACPSKLRRSP